MGDSLSYLDNLLTVCKCCLTIVTKIKLLIINRDSAIGVLCRCFLS